MECEEPLEARFFETAKWEVRACVSRLWQWESWRSLGVGTYWISSWRACSLLVRLSQTDIRMDFTQTGSGRVDSGQCQVAKSGEYGTDPPHSTTVDKFLDKLSDSQLLKNSAPRSIDRSEEPVALESQSPHCILYCEGCQVHLVRFTQQSVSW
jgi:hypothetical protein